MGSGTVEFALDSLRHLLLDDVLLAKPVKVALEVLVVLDDIIASRLDGFVDLFHLPESLVVGGDLTLQEELETADLHRVQDLGVVLNSREAFVD